MSKTLQFLRANELEIFSSVKTYINQGVRLDVRDNTRLVSTYTGDRYTGIRFGPGSMVESNNLRVIGHGVINLNSMFITARGSLVIESQGNRANNNISIDKKSSIKGNTISIISGNNFSFKDRSFLRSEQNSHVAASGCLVQSGTTMEAATYSGSCLNAQRVNRIPVVMAAATPSSGEAPLTVDFSSTGSNDPDGDIETYEWAFPDGSYHYGCQCRVRIYRGRRPYCSPHGH